MSAKARRRSRRRRPTPNRKTRQHVPASINRPTSSNTLRTAAPARVAPAPADVAVPRMDSVAAVVLVGAASSMATIGLVNRLATVWTVDRAGGNAALLATLLALVIGLWTALRITDPMATNPPNHRSSLIFSWLRRALAAIPNRHAPLAGALMAPALAAGLCIVLIQPLQLRAASSALTMLLTGFLWSHATQWVAVGALAFLVAIPTVLFCGFAVGVAIASGTSARQPGMNWFRWLLLGALGGMATFFILQRNVASTSVPLACASLPALVASVLCAWPTADRQSARDETRDGPRAEQRGSYSDTVQHSPSPELPRSRKAHPR